MAERVKEQEFEEGFLHGWDGSECIYYTDEKYLYYNDAEAPCHHCHHYTRKTQQKGERIAENYLETRNKVIENCWRMIVGNDTPKQEDGWLEYTLADYMRTVQNNSENNTKGAGQ